VQLKLWVKLVSDSLENALNLATQQGQHGDNDNGDQNEDKGILNKTLAFLSR
jgi:hypothetical protein